MSEWEKQEEDKTISLDDLENIERERERKREQRDDPFYNENDWGDSYDDLDSEAWERQYRQDDEDEIESDPWGLE